MQNKSSGPKSVEPKPASRAQRKAQHVEANKALWESAENPETFHFVETKNDVPLKSAPKTAMKVLSRKPKQEQPKLAKRSSSALPTNDMQNLELGEEEDIDSEEEERREKERGLKARQEQARVEREEKQKKYKEVRERLFGTTPESTPNAQASNTAKLSRSSSGQRQSPVRPDRKPAANDGSDPTSSADQSPSRPPKQQHAQLFEPGYAPKPGSTFLQGRNGTSRSPQPESQHIRQPRGPDGSGRGGFGFSSRNPEANVT